MVNGNQKGKRGERELAGALRQLGFANARRGQQYSGIGGDDIADAIGGVHIECKRVEQLNLWAAMLQSIRDSDGDDVPCVMHRKNQQQWLVTIRLSDLITFADAVALAGPVILHSRESQPSITTDSPSTT